MIIGTGIDLVNSKRIQKLMDEYGDKFFEKYFTSDEKTHVLKQPVQNQALSLAKRFAAKEACAKALGTGFQNGLHMKDMNITNDSYGKPELSLHGQALEQLHALAPQHLTTKIHLSLTDEPPYAQAQVIIEAI